MITAGMCVQTGNGTSYFGRLGQLNNYRANDIAARKYLGAHVVQGNALPGMGGSLLGEGVRFRRVYGYKKLTNAQCSGLNGLDGDRPVVCNYLRPSSSTMVTTMLTP